MRYRFGRGKDIMLRGLPRRGWVRSKAMPNLVEVQLNRPARERCSLRQIGEEVRVRGDLEQRYNRIRELPVTSFEGSK